MYISKIVLENFRSFYGKHELNLSKSINFFVGNNNCGKTTIFKAIDFIQSGKIKDKYIYISKGLENQNVSVEIELTGEDLEKYISSDNSNLKKYRDFLIDNEDGTFSIRIMRSSEITEITQNKKNVKLDINSIRIFDPTSENSDFIKRYTNPTGIDKTINALFDAQFVYSDLNNEDYQDFGKTKIIGKIINDLTQDFQKEFDEQGNKTVWGEFKEAHKKAFGKEGILGLLGNLESQLDDILKNQYGDGDIKFSFGLPEIDSLLKFGNILMSDSGVSTLVSEKGTGMQRALALSLIQVYANISQKRNGLEKPIFFFIDEPETFLHPSAQNNLINSLVNLSKKSQVFLTTHSPYLLRLFKNNEQNLYIFTKKEGKSDFSKKQMMILSNKNFLSWAEINFYAFGIYSIELHNELFSYLHEFAINDDKNNYRITTFDNWLVGKGLRKDRDYIYNKENCSKNEKCTLPYLIRNAFHHPENKNNSYSQDDLNYSIEQLIKIIKEVSGSKF